MNNRTFTPSPDITIANECDIQQGDYLILGKRTWEFAGRSEEFPQYAHEQNEFVFNQTSESHGALGLQRVFSQSELKALIDAGFLWRKMPVNVRIGQPSGVR